VRVESPPTASRTRALIRIHSVDSGHQHDRGARLVAHLILHGTRRSRQLDGERHLLAIDLEILDESERDDVAVKIRILHDLQRVEHGGFRYGHEPRISALPRQ
jgi:hypothetical protein